MKRLSYNIHDECKETILLYLSQAKWLARYFEFFSLTSPTAIQNIKQMLHVMIGVMFRERRELSTKSSPFSNPILKN